MAVSVAVSEIFSVKEWCDLENMVMVFKIIGNGTISYIAYDFLFALHSNYNDILYHLRDIASYWSKIAKFLYPTSI